MTVRQSLVAALLATAMVGANAAGAAELAYAAPLSGDGTFSVVRAALACPDGTMAVLSVAGNSVTVPALELPSDPAVLADCLIDVVLHGATPVSGGTVAGTLFVAGKQFALQPGVPQPTAALYVSQSGDVHVNLRLAGLLAAGGQSLLQVSGDDVAPTEVALVLQAE